MIKSPKVQNVQVSNMSLEMIQARLKKVLSYNLSETFLVPEVIEGLVDYLSDVVCEDPEQAKLFGILPSV